MTVFTTITVADIRIRLRYRIAQTLGDLIGDLTKPHNESMNADPDNAALLEMVLSAQRGLGSIQLFEDSSLLRALLDAAPKILRSRRKTTLFEAIHVLNLETPHSDFLAWLLDPLGPLTDNWLLRAFLVRISPQQIFDVDVTVEREVPVALGRLDILISWSSFKLIIENKVWSPEGDEQISRYLRSGVIAGENDGRIVYLSPLGRMPVSVKPNDPRVTAMSYQDVVNLLDDGLNSGREIDPRGRMFALEFRNCILRLLKVRYEMNKPQISESTKIYLGKAKRLRDIKSLALDESAQFLQWMYSEAERRLRLLAGPDLILHQGKYVAVFRLPEWKYGEFIFGILFGMDHDPTKYLISEPGSGPWVGIGAWRSDDVFDPKGCQVIVNALHPMLTKYWPHPQDLRDPDATMALWREMAIPENGDLDGWSESLVAFIEELALVLRPALNNVAATFNAVVDLGTTDTASTSP
jgi:hypothetical protein